jgi:hypothetical protein
MGQPFFVVGEGIWARLRRRIDFSKGGRAVCGTGEEAAEKARMKNAFGKMN